MVIYGMLQAFLQGALELYSPTIACCAVNSLIAITSASCVQLHGLLEFNPVPFAGTLSPASIAHLLLTSAWAVCLYNETAQKLLHAFKYSSKTSLHKTFVPLMIDFIDRHSNTRTTI